MDARPAVLVIDDHVDVVRAIVRVLRRDFFAEGTTSCVGALRRLAGGERFAAIVCDVAMREMSGQEFLAAVARLDRAQSRRVVFLSAGVLGDEVRAFADAHASIEKPFVGEPLRARIWSFVSRPVGQVLAFA